MPFRIETRRYRDSGRIAVEIYEDDGQPFAGLPYGTLSVNVPGVQLEGDEFVLNHDLNGPMFDGLRRELLEDGWCEDTGKRCDYGFVRRQPIWRLVKKVG